MKLQKGKLLIIFFFMFLILSSMVFVVNQINNSTASKVLEGVYESSLEDKAELQDFKNGISKINNQFRTTFIVQILIIMFLIATSAIMIKSDTIDSCKQKLDSYNLESSDLLTGLYNREYLLENADKFIHNCRESDNVAALFIDLDNFNKVNDKSGQKAGDEVLISIAQYIKKVILKFEYFNSIVSKKSVITRYGDDKFFVILPCIKDAKELEDICITLIKDMNKNTTCKYIHKYNLSFSIGAVLYKELECDKETLIITSDEAMQEIKSSTKNSYKVMDYTT